MKLTKHEIERLLAVMDANNADSDAGTSGYLWGAGHEVAHRVVDAMFDPGAVTYAGVRAAAVAVLAHISPAARAHVRHIIADEERMWSELQRRRAAVTALVDLLGIDADAADKIIDQQEKLHDAVKIVAEAVH